MPRRTNILWAVAIVAVLAALWSMPGTAPAQTTASAPKPLDKLAIGEAEVTQLLLLMDTDKNGKISKKEFMAFMDAEFERLDKDKSGELDAKELRQSKLRVSHPAPPLAGK
jgi:hypothetical protein